MAQTLGFGDLLQPGQQNQQQQQNAQTGAPSTTPSAGQQGTAVGSAASAPTMSTPQSGSSQPGAQYKPAAYSQQGQGTGFVNLQQYLNANNPTQLQNAVVSNLGSQNQTAYNNLNAAQQQFQTQTGQNQANTASNQQLVQNVLANPLQYTNVTGNNTAQVGGGAGTANQASMASQATPQNQALGSQFSQLISGQYGGPTALNNASQLSASAAANAQNAQNLGSMGGRQSILQGLMANPQYTQGQSNLDAYLLGQGNQQSLNQAQNQALALQNMTNQSITGAQQQGQEQQSNAQQFAQQTQQQLANTAQQMQAGLTNQAAAQQGQSNQQYVQMLSDLQSGNITQQEAQQLGLTQGENVYNVLQNPSNFITRSPVQATAANVATPQQYAQMQALNQLAGSSAPAAATGVFQQFANPSQAGTFANTPGYTVNQNALNTGIQANQANYNSTVDPALSQLQNAQQIMNAYTNAGMSLNGNNIVGSSNYNNAIAAIQAQGNGAALQGNEFQNLQWAANNLAAQQQAYANAQQTAQQAGLGYNPINIQGNKPLFGPQLGRLMNGQQQTGS